MQGVGTLLPWNSFITVPTYFSTKFQGSAYEVRADVMMQEPAATDRMPLQNNSANYFTFSFQFAGITMLLLSIFYQHNFTIKSRVVLPMILQLIVFSATTALVKVLNSSQLYVFLIAAQASIDPDNFFAATLACVVVSGGLCFHGNTCFLVHAMQLRVRSSKAASLAWRGSFLLDTPRLS